MSSNLERRVAEAVAIVDGMADAGATARILGVVGIVLHCRHGEPNGAHREPEDIDLIVARAAGARLGAVLDARGYEGNARFNALHGDRRRIYNGPGGKVDVFVGAFAMCHRLELEDRLTVDNPTLSAADLVLTKLQIVELTEKDLLDLRRLLEDHELGSGPGDWIDADYIASVLAEDWGYWRTATGTLQRLTSAAPHLTEKAEALSRRVDEAPKSRRFKMRAKVGDRRRWYELPENVG